MLTRNVSEKGGNVKIISALFRKVFYAIVCVFNVALYILLFKSAEILKKVLNEK